MRSLLELLTAHIAGGGPTGVEFAAELHDLLNTDIKKHYPTLHRLARITLFDVAPNILGSFDESLQEYVTYRLRQSSCELTELSPRISFAVKRFKREGIRILTQHHVEKVEEVFSFPSLNLLQDVKDQTFTNRVSSSSRKREKVTSALHICLAKFL